MNVRTAKRNDLGRLVDIYNQAIQAGRRTAHTTPFTVEERIPWFEEHRADIYPILVVDNGSDVLGYLTISPYRQGRMALRYTAEVSSYVDFSRHHQGVGTILLQHAINRCPSLGIKTLIAILLGSNEASIALLTKFGFEQWGCMPKAADFDGVELDHLYYGKRVVE